MVVTTYQGWLHDGKPVKISQPAADLKATMEQHGYTVYALGDQSHLEHHPPQDHTPYSNTPYPGPQPYPFVLAIDIMPGGDLDWRDLGLKIVADKNAGLAGTEPIKYINFTDRSEKCWQESWEGIHKRSISSDKGHVHISFRTDYVHSRIMAEYDPINPKAPALTGTLADINGDGLVDILARSSEGELYVYPGTGGSGLETFGERYLVGTSWSGMTSINVADINGDGHADLLARTADGELYVYPGTGGTGLKTFGQRYLVGTAWKAMTAICVGDINGDGHPDILARTADGELYVYPGTGGAGSKTFGERYLVGTSWSGMTSINVADINGDGHADLLARTADGELYVYPGTGGTGLKTFGQPYLVGTTWGAMTAIVIGDVNGDGRVDLLARTAEGELYVYPGTGGSGIKTFGERYLVGTSWKAMTALVIGDVTGDGHADILARIPAGELHLYPGTGGDGLKTFGAPILVGTEWNAATAIT